MRSSKDTFFMLLAESLVLSLLFGMLGADREIARWILIILVLSFIISYSGSFMFSKCIRKYGDKYYTLIILTQQLLISTLMYVISLIMGYNTSYIKFMTIYIVLSIVTYNLNKRLFMKEIKYLNSLIKENR